MPEGAILLIVTAGLLSGWLFLIPFFSQNRLAPVETGPNPLLGILIAALTLGLLLNGWLAFFLAEAGWFSIQTVALLWFLPIVGLALHYRRYLLAPLTRAIDTGNTMLPFIHVSVPNKVEYLVLALWLIPAVWLFFRPHEYIMGAADSGVYVNLAAHIADEGSILITDPTLEGMDPLLYPALLRERPASEGTPYYLFPGFNVVYEPRGVIYPDFYHLHPVWQAVAFGLGGVQAALLITGLWSLLGTLAAYMVLRDLAGWPTALLVLIGLTLNGLQIWFARYPTTEMLTQYLLWIGLWALGRWVRSQQPLALWGLLAGLAIGQVMLVRIDMIFILMVPALAAGWLLLKKRWLPVHFWFFLPLALLSVHSLVHAALISRSYFTRISNYVLLMTRLYWNMALILGVLFVASLLLLFYFRHSLKRYSRPITASLAGLILLLALFAWFIRPNLGSIAAYTDWYSGQSIQLVDRENLLRLAWYLSPAGVWLGILGAALLVYRLRLETMFLVAVGISFSLLYLWRMQATPHHVYVMRRYVPVILPFFILAASYLLGQIGMMKTRWRLGGLLLTMIWLAGFAWQAQGFISQVDYQGMIRQIEALDEQLEEKSILIFEDPSLISIGDLLGPPLHYLHGHDVFILRDAEALPDSAFRDALNQWQNEGRTIYWIQGPAEITEPGWLEKHNIPYQQTPYTIQSNYLEASYEHRPSMIIPVYWQFLISYQEPEKTTTNE